MVYAIGDWKKVICYIFRTCCEPHTTKSGTWDASILKTTSFQNLSSDTFSLQVDVTLYMYSQSLYENIVVNRKVWISLIFSVLLHPFGFLVQFESEWMTMQTISFSYLLHLLTWSVLQIMSKRSSVFHAYCKWHPIFFIKFLKKLACISWAHSVWRIVIRIMKNPATLVLGQFTVFQLHHLKHASAFLFFV